MRTPVLLLLLALPALAFPQGKTPVSVEHTGDDAAGQLFAFELKEAIRASHGMHLVTGELEPRIKVVLVSHDDSFGEEKGRRTAIAISILYDALDVPLGGAFLTSSVQICGRAVAATCARGVLSLIDKHTDSLRTRAPRLWQTIN
jgi:hypothetical protein